MTGGVMHTHLADLLAGLAARDPEKPIFTFLYQDREEQVVSAARLHHDARVLFPFAGRAGGEAGRDRAAGLRPRPRSRGGVLGRRLPRRRSDHPALRLARRARQELPRAVAVLRAWQPEGPYHLGGYCLGGVVAFEMAQQLEAAGEDVALVAILEGFAPRGRAGRAGVWREWQYALDLLLGLPYWLRDYLRLERIEMRVRNRRLRRLLRKRLWGIAGAQVELEAADLLDSAASQPARIQRALTAHIAAMHAYAPAPYPGRLVLFRTPQRLLRSPRWDRGWGELTNEPVDVQPITGAHGTILQEPHVRVLADKLAAYLRPAG